MAAGNFTLFNIAKEKLIRGTIDIDTHSFKAMLTGSSQSLDATFAGTSTDCRKADLTNEVTGAGYSAGGVAVTITVSRSTGTVTVDSTDPQWTSATFTAKYCVWYDDTATNKDLLGFAELETGSTLSPSNGTLLVTVNASGLFTFA